MSDPASELRRIDWKAILPFTQIFRAFRMACHPSTLCLAFAMVLLTGLWGYALDGMAGRSHRPLVGEVDNYWRVRNVDQWRDAAFQAQAAMVGQLISGSDLKPETDPAELASEVADKYEKNPIATIDKWLGRIELKFEKDRKAIEETDLSGDEKDRQLAELGAKYNPLHFRLNQLRPKGVFNSFMKYQQSVARQAIEAACGLNFFGGLQGLLDRQPIAVDGGTARATSLDEVGVMGCVVLAGRGKQWLATEHPFFGLIFGLPVLGIWALFGGAICRICALYAARDERASMNDALAFAKKKFLNFFVVLLIPSGLIFLVGAVLWGGGLVSGIPILGDILMAFAMPISLALGALMTIVVIGAIGGGFMFFSAIAAEGSDGFDALSRSFSFVGSKPWNTALYAIVATVYGAICYLFVRFFVFVMLSVTRAFVAAGMFATSRPALGNVDATKIDGIWSPPTFDHLYTAPPVLGTNSGDGLSEFLVTLFVLLVVIKLCAFIVAFFYSSATTIYLLLRRDVDGIDIGDVYLDDGDDTLGYFDATTMGEPESAEPVVEEAPAVEAETPETETPAPSEPDDSAGDTLDKESHEENTPDEDKPAE